MNDFIRISIGDRVEVNHLATPYFAGQRGTVVGIEEERPFELGEETAYQVQMDETEPGVIHVWLDRFIDYVSVLQDDAGLPVEADSATDADAALEEWVRELLGLGAPAVDEDDEEVCADPRCCPQGIDEEVEYDFDYAVEPEPELLIDPARLQALQAAYEVLGGENVHVADVTIAAHFLLGECC